jgi:hypothetical protein
VTCGRCVALEQRAASLAEEVAYLRSELGLSVQSEVIGRLRGLIAANMAKLYRQTGIQGGGAVGPARLVAALYAAHGRPLTKRQLMDAVPPRSGGDDERDEQIVNVCVCRARDALGAALIENIWGRGYRLSEWGMARVRDIIGPQVGAA